MVLKLALTVAVDVDDEVQRKKVNSIVERGSESEMRDLIFLELRHQPAAVARDLAGGKPLLELLAALSSESAKPPSSRLTTAAVDIAERRSP